MKKAGNAKRVEKKNKRGRPNKKDGIDLERLAKLCIAGCTNAQIAIAFGICEKTLYTYMREDKDFLHTVKNNVELADSLVERSLWERAIGYSHPEEKIFQYEGTIIRAETTRQYPPDTAAAFIWLKNRKSDKWKDKQEVQQSGEVILRYDDGTNTAKGNPLR